MAFTQDDVNNWFTANPGATQQDVANAVQGLGGLDANPELAGMIGQHYGTDAETVNTAYNQFTAPAAATVTPAAVAAPVAPNPFDQMSTAYNAGDYTGVNSLLAANKYTPEQIQQQYGLTAGQLDDIRSKGVNLGYTTPEITNYVSGVLADKTLSPWEQTNKILETAQKTGVGLDQLQNIYGQDVVNQSLGDYKTGIQDYLTKTLAQDSGTTMNEIGQIHKAAQQYGLDATDLAKFGGMDQKTAQVYFDMYDKGLGNIVSSLNDPKTTDLQKTQTALALQQKFGTTDEELAKASGGKYTALDIKSYLDPVRNVPNNLQKLFNDPNATAYDIQKFVEEAKKDPRAAGIYGAALDKVTVNNPALLFRDVVNGNNSYQNAKDFLATAKSTPELATQYAKQIQGIEQILAVTDRARNKDFGGKLPDYAMSMFLGLDKQTQASAPKQLTGEDKGVTPISDEDGNITGYTKKVDSSDFQHLQANYDANGKLLGYEDRSSRVHVSDPQYYYAKFDANGVAQPGTGANRSGGFLKNTLQDVASMGPVGQIALMAATGGLGGALASQLGGGLLANALASGVVSGALSEVGGGDFGKGFAGGAVGSGVGSLAGSYMPTDMTGSPMVDAYLAKALPTAAGSMARAGVMGGSLEDAGLYSLLNTGVNMGTNELLRNTPLSTLDPSVRPYATGVASNLVSSTLAGKNPNVQNALMNTMLQQAMKPAAKP